MRFLRPKGCITIIMGMKHVCRPRGKIWRKKKESMFEKGLEQGRQGCGGAEASAGLYAKEAAGILLIFQKHHSERGSPARAG